MKYLLIRHGIDQNESVGCSVVLVPRANHIVLGKRHTYRWLTNKKISLEGKKEISALVGGLLLEKLYTITW